MLHGYKMFDFRGNDESATDQQTSTFWICEIEQYIDFMKRKSVVTGFSCLPKPPLLTLQHGYTCGYHALSTILSFWHARNSDYTAIPPTRAAVKDKSVMTLKKLGRLNGLEPIGGIFDARDFNKILQTTQYCASTTKFSTQTEMCDKITLALENHLPVILPIDWLNYTPVQADGKHAHFITVIGCFKNVDGQSEIVYASGGFYYSSPAEDIFKSTNNLSELPQCTYYKDDRNSEWRRSTGLHDLLFADKFHVQKKADLTNLKNRLVLVYPKELAPLYEDLYKPVVGLSA